MRHIAALDGLRGVAVLIVFAQHAGVPGTGGGGAAVDVFFVLSGFLITGLLIDERTRAGRIDIGRFYLRRFLRLTPALAILAIAYAVAAPDDVGSAVLSLFYLTDYARAFFVEAGPLSHTWSLAVEERFYLLWPAALLVLSRLPPRRLLFVLTGAYVLATAHRCGAAWLQGYDAAYFRFDTRLSGLILGSLLAALVRSGIDRDRTTLTAIALGLLTAGAFAPASGELSLTLGIAIAEAAALRIILTAAVEEAPSAITRLLSMPALAYVGRISYGLYLFHHPLTFALDGAMHWTGVVALTLPASLALAALSYHFVERPLLARRAATRTSVEAVAEARVGARAVATSRRGASSARQPSVAARRATIAASRRTSRVIPARPSGGTCTKPTMRRVPSAAWSER
jgi:peptidoglycan/LPS O-acetylase OafA/YrhL